MSETNNVPQEMTPESETARISLIVSKDLRDALIEQAGRERRSLNGQCVVLIERGMQAETAAAA